MDYTKHMVFFMTSLAHLEAAEYICIVDEFLRCTGWSGIFCFFYKPEMVNAPEGLNKVILRKMKRFDCKTNQV